MNSTNETLLFDRFLIVYNLCVFTCIIFIFVFHCTHVRMSYVLNFYLLNFTYLLIHTRRDGDEGIVKRLQAPWWRLCLEIVRLVADGAACETPLRKHLQRTINQSIKLIRALSGNVTV